MQKEETHEFKVLGELKKAQGIEEPKRKPKKTKGPNPLSCKKKKQLYVPPKPVPKATNDGEKKKPARRRKKKPKAEAGPSNEAST